MHETGERTLSVLKKVQMQKGGIGEKKEDWSAAEERCSGSWQIGETLHNRPWLRTAVSRPPFYSHCIYILLMHDSFSFSISSADIPVCFIAIPLFFMLFFLPSVQYLFCLSIACHNNFAKIYNKSHMNQHCTPLRLNTTLYSQPHNNTIALKVATHLVSTLLQSLCWQRLYCTAVSATVPQSVPG